MDAGTTMMMTKPGRCKLKTVANVCHHGQLIKNVMVCKGDAVFPIAGVSSYQYVSSDSIFAHSAK